MIVREIWAVVGSSLRRALEKFITVNGLFSQAIALPWVGCACKLYLVLGGLSVETTRLSWVGCARRLLGVVGWFPG